MLEVMMKEGLIISAFVLVILGFGGVHAKVDTSSDPLRPTFRISRCWYTSMPADVGYIGVKVKDGNDWKEVWVLINKTLGKYPPLTEIKYGVTPAGLADFIPPHTLQPGRVYMFAVHLAEYSDKVFFKIMDRDGKPVIHVLDKAPE